MKSILFVGFLCCAALCYGQMGGGMNGQMGGMGGTNRPTNNGPLNDPTRFPNASQTPQPFDESPKDAFAHDPKLASKLQTLLPDGPTIQEVCDGFKKMGDCVSAIHASQNVGIPLNDLKSKMTGKGSKNLEKSLRELKPDLDAKAEKKKAYQQAERDLPTS